jgi:hypothetical protein
LGQETERLFFGRPIKRFLWDDAATIAKSYKTYFLEMARQRFRKELRERTALNLGHPKFRDAVEELATIVLKEMAVSESRVRDVIRSVMRP